MDRMGLKEGEVIQHSMISKSIERAQRKVEENHFGTRKRLLEYDDVMNAQREVIYKKRRHALYGERLALDLQNMLFDLNESMVVAHQEDRDFAGYNFELMRNFAVDSPLTEQEFMGGKAEDVADKIYHALDQHYRTKSSAISERAYPIIKQVYEQQGQQFENIVVPFSDGIRTVQVLANLKKSYESQGSEMIRAFERSIALSFIDDSWKEHLREMDDLKQSVQNAVYEQKDPLLIYKFESFELFKKMVDAVNRDTMSFLFKGKVAIDEPQQVKQAPLPQRSDMSKLKATHDEFQQNVSSSAGQGNMPPQGPPPPVKHEPVRVEKQVGRNEPCPCGSGKKYKSCHGAMVEG
jgi:preprotein translocase subunit SecA